LKIKKKKRIQNDEDDDEEVGGSQGKVIAPKIKKKYNKFLDEVVQRGSKQRTTTALIEFKVDRECEVDNS
jgi:hypothetical protein